MREMAGVDGSANVRLADGAGAQLRRAAVTRDEMPARKEDAVGFPVSAHFTSLRLVKSTFLLSHHHHLLLLLVVCMHTQLGLS